MLTVCLSNLDSFQHRRGFIHCLLKFGSGIGICDDACTRLHSEHVAASDHRADGETGIHVAVEAEVAHSASIDAARVWFEFGDNFQCTDLWRAANGPCWEGRAHQIEGS